MRFKKQEVFIGKRAQKHIEKAHVTIIGCGALGSVAAELLARAGVRKLTLIDRDLVDLSNLQRQSLYTEADIGKLKALALANHLKKINVLLQIEAFAIDLESDNSEVLKADLVLDGTDNFYTRFLINDFCKKEDIPWVFASATGASGFVFPMTKESPCFNCIFKEPSIPLGSCDTEGILNTIVHSIASFQVTEALKILTHQNPSKDLLFFNIWNKSMLTIKVRKKDSCSTCKKKFEFLSGEKPKEIIKICGSNLFQMRGNPLDLNLLKTKFSKLGQVRKEQHCLFFNELIIFKDGRVLIKTNSKERAKALYDKYIG